jgi:hypothetical protein
MDEYYRGNEKRQLSQKESVTLKSVLGKLIQQEFGREGYLQYAEKLDKKESMDIFCDIYEKLRHESAEDLNHALKKLLDSVQASIRISRNFLYISLGFVVTVVALILLMPPAPVLYVLCALAGVSYLYKAVEFLCNRYCDRDVRMVLIYKIALFHLLEESGLQKEGHELQ